jgi:hypothetical protein
MRNLILAALCLTLMAGAFAQDAGFNATVMPGTTRTYKTDSGVQSDALVEFRSPAGEYERSRYAVTGCDVAVPVKLIGRVLGDGVYIKDTIREWNPKGDRVYDTIAMTICIEARKK